MDKSKVDFFIAANSGKFDPVALVSVRETLEKMNDDQFAAIQATSFRDPSTILLIAILTGWDRFFLDDVGMGILKVLTCYGCWIWWIVDMFSATDRAKKYNYNKFMQTAALLK